MGTPLDRCDHSLGEYLVEIWGRRNRLFRTIVFESTHMIWKIHCERVIAWGDNLAKRCSEYMIHNKWPRAINSRLRMDSIYTNKIFNRGIIEPKTVLKTRADYLKDEVHEVRNWCSNTEILVGIPPKRPASRSR